jgi:hypothetical protein
VTTCRTFTVAGSTDCGSALKALSAVVVTSPDLTASATQLQ